LPQAGSKSDDEGDEWNAFDEDDEDHAVPLFRRPAFLMIVGLIIFLIIAAVVILNPPAQTPGVTETVAPTDASSVVEVPSFVPETLAPTDASSIAQVPTLENTIPTEAIPTLEPTTESATIPAVETTPSSDTGFDNILSALSSFELPDPAATTEKTNLGDTLLVSVCTEAGAKMRQTLPAVIDALAPQLQSLPADLSGVGIRMLDCASNTALLMIGVSADDVHAFVDGNLDKEAFQAKWQPLS
jgi:hypothetical protein